jgi:hypothetical protein
MMRGEWDSNPRVLSNMGLAIPRPTRLGDPRPYVRVTHASKSCGIILIIGEPAKGEEVDYPQYLKRL